MLIFLFFQDHNCCLILVWELFLLSLSLLEDKSQFWALKSHNFFSLFFFFHSLFIFFSVVSRFGLLLKEREKQPRLLFPGSWHGIQLGCVISLQGHSMPRNKYIRRTFHSLNCTHTKTVTLHTKERTKFPLLPGNVSDCSFFTSYSLPCSISPAF